MTRITVPSPRRSSSRAPTTPTLDDLFRPAASQPRYKRRPTPNLRAPVVVDRSTLTAGPHAMPQAPVDITAVYDRPMGDILDRVRSSVRPPRQRDYLHVSDLIYRCVRAFGLQEALGQHPLPQQLRLADRLTYRQGEAIAEVIVSSVQSAAPAALWGNWECRCRKTRTPAPCTYAEATAAPACEYCDQPLDNYCEVPMFNEEYMIVGNPDLLLFLEDFNAFHITELKSITPNEFPDLSGPKPEHVLQVIFYWWLMRELNYRLTTKASIVYVTKGHTFVGNVYKEFQVDVQSQLSRLDMFLEEAAALKAYRAGDGPLPPRVRCNTPEDTTAKKCHVCQACFASAQGPSRRRAVDLTALGADEDASASVEPTARSAARPEPRLTPPTRPSRVPGAADVPLRRGPVPGVNRVRTPPPRRR